MAKHREIRAAAPVVESETEDSEASDFELEPQPAKKGPVTASSAKAAVPAPVPVVEPDTEDSEASDSEPEPQPTKKAPVAALSAKAAAPAPDSSSGSKYESDSDEGLPPKKPDSNGTSVKPMAVPVKTAPATPATGIKRSKAPSATQVTGTKRSKKGAATEEGKKLFERIFTVEDEIVVLEELLKKHPVAKESPEMDSMYEAIKARVCVPVSKVQVLDKMRRLKSKFFKKKEKFANTKKKKGTEEETGKDELYELSKKIWGNEEGPKTVENKKEKGKGKGKGKGAVTFARAGKSIGDWVFGEGTELVAEEGRINLEKKWGEIRKEETGLFVKRLELSLEHAKMVYDSL